ncbi:hypothetical protein Taro_005637 [Colocasia esculenta]|uniref:Aminotransferase-like plant mobile domain-containing protein n=1 Tax=Colocasia esculenta TaxID=4460 RepID=A0A843TUV7_COLES|nr:hypothetical protein [Colocasia esculenta]
MGDLHHYHEMLDQRGRHLSTCRLSIGVSGIPVSGHFYEEVYLDNLHRDCSTGKGSYIMSYSFRYLMKVWRDLARCGKEQCPKASQGNVRVSFNAWVRFFYNSPYCFCDGFASDTHDPASYMQLSVDFEDNHRHLCALRDGGRNPRRLPDRTYLAAYVMYWLGTFVLPFGGRGVGQAGAYISDESDKRRIYHLPHHAAAETSFCKDWLCYIRPSVLAFRKGSSLYLEPYYPCRFARNFSHDQQLVVSSWWCYFARHDPSPGCFIPEQQREGRVDIYYVRWWFRHNLIFREHASHIKEAEDARLARTEVPAELISASFLRQEFPTLAGTTRALRHRSVKGQASALAERNAYVGALKPLTRPDSCSTASRGGGVSPGQASALAERNAYVGALKPLTRPDSCSTASRGGGVSPVIYSWWHISCWTASTPWTRHFRALFSQRASSICQRSRNRPLPIAESVERAKRQVLYSRLPIGGPQGPLPRTRKLCALLGMRVQSGLRRMKMRTLSPMTTITPLDGTPSPDGADLPGHHPLSRGMRRRALLLVRKRVTISSTTEPPGTTPPEEGEIPRRTSGESSDTVRLIEEFMVESPTIASSPSIVVTAGAGTASPSPAVTSSLPGASEPLTDGSAYALAGECSCLPKAPGLEATTGDAREATCSAEGSRSDPTPSGTQAADGDSLQPSSGENFPGESSTFSSHDVSWPDAPRAVKCPGRRGA